MKIRIELDCDNAAFEDTPASEAARVLRALCDTIEG